MWCAGSLRNVAACALVAALFGCGESERSNGGAGAGGTGNVAGTSGGSGGSGAGTGGTTGGTAGAMATGGTAGGSSGAGGGSGAGGSSGGSTGGQGGEGGAGGSGDYFISVLVDGVPVRAEMSVRAFWFQGLLDGWLELEGSTGERTFYFVVRNVVASNVCSYMTMQDLALPPTMVEASFVDGGVCNVTVTTAAPEIGDVFEGTFDAAVAALGGSDLTLLTEGRFRAPRTPDGGAQ